jgi:hypothetical protein
MCTYIGDGWAQGVKDADLPFLDAGLQFAG